MIKFRPKLFDTLPGYGRTAFTQDLSAGITVGVLALPLAICSGSGGLRLGMTFSPPSSLATAAAILRV